MKSSKFAVMGVLGALAGLAGCAAEVGGAGDVGSTEEELRGVTFVDVCLVPRGNYDVEVDLRLPQRAADRLLARTPSYPGPCYQYGDANDLGDGYVQTYAQYDRHGEPLALGVTFPASMLQSLPSEPSDGNHCFDVDGDGHIDPMHECVGGHENVLYMPDRVLEDPNVPFSWSLVNWNPFGHAPPTVYTYPHFDFHFYILDLETRNAIGAGPCALLIDCDDFETATAPIPPRYVPQDFQSVGAAEAAMGDHLVDLTAKEWSEPGSFDHTWIYGAWDGSIAFYEPMITRDYLLGQPDTCVPLKLPEAWETAGYYPLEYCMRYRPNRDDYTVSMERFVWRDAG